MNHCWESRANGTAPGYHVTLKYSHTSTVIYMYNSPCTHSVQLCVLSSTTSYVMNGLVFVSADDHNSCYFYVYITKNNCLAFHIAATLQLTHALFQGVHARARNSYMYSRTRAGTGLVRILLFAFTCGHVDVELAWHFGGCTRTSGRSLERLRGLAMSR